MGRQIHPIYGDLVYRRPYEVASEWYLVDGDAKLSVVEWYIDDGATPDQVIDRMLGWHRETSSVETIQKLADARKAFWDQQRDF